MVIIQISMKELISLKNKLHNINKTDNSKDISDKNDKIKEKRKTLLIFKNVINNIELIVNEYMNVLRTKGSSLDIKISIKVKKDSINYYLGSDPDPLLFEKKILKKKLELKIF